MDNEKRIEELLSEMTTEEKVGLIHANSLFTAAGVERLGIDELTMSDGPHGVREEMQRLAWVSANRDDDFCTYLPTGTALASTWNPSLASLFGHTLGEEARAREKDIILGPSINIIRTPLCGRTFEYMSEDPVLIEEIAPEVVKGIQSHDTAACVKHFALNNQELDRMNYNVEVSDRALNEIYLKGFKSAIVGGEAWSVMGAYNKFRGQFCCHNAALNKILRDDWGFDGVLVSDWGGAHDETECIENGLDLEMGTPVPYDNYYLGKGLIEKADSSPEIMGYLNEKVRRILRLMMRVKKGSPDRQKGSFSTKEHQSATYTIASEAMVLLKNDKKLLPLTADKTDNKKILVYGEGATAKNSSGGNSSGLKCLYEITTLDGIKNKFAKSEINYVQAVKYTYSEIPVEYLDITDKKAGCRAFVCESFEDSEFSGEPYKVQYVNKMYAGHSGEGSMRYTGILNIPEDGRYSFLVKANIGSEFLFDGKTAHGFTSDTEYVHTVSLKKGDRISLELRLVNTLEVEPAMLWSGVTCVTPEDKLFSMAKEADYVFICAGQTHIQDSEGYDRDTMVLPNGQDEIISKLLKLNKNTVMIMTSGSPVEMPWIEDAHTILWTWYAGMEYGNVTADILRGEINPSGKLPLTMPKKYEDTPVYRYGEYKEGDVHYNDDIFVGYRGYDKDGIEPLFCFGHGLSYSEFKYSDLTVTNGDNGVTFALNVENLSDIAGKETVQIYAGYKNPSPDRPLRELKKFRKVEIAPHGKERVEFTLTADDMKIYDEKIGGWTLGTDEYTVEVSSSSRNVRLSFNVTLKK